MIMPAARTIANEMLQEYRHFSDIASTALRGTEGGGSCMIRRDDYNADEDASDRDGSSRMR